MQILNTFVHNMEYVKYSEFVANKNFYLEQALQGKIFIYPTDTIYGIWWVTYQQTTEKIKDIKGRKKLKPLSVIAPDITWIQKNFIVPNNFSELVNKFLKQYHGFTLLLTKQEIEFMPHISPNYKVWVRIINHDFQNFVAEIGQPFITTSANIAGLNPAASISELDEEIIQQVDYIIDGWSLIGIPSVLIDLDTDEEIHRQ